MTWWGWLLVGAVGGTVVTFVAWWWALARPPRVHR